MHIILAFLGAIAGVFAVRNLASLRKIRQQIKRGGKIDLLAPIIYSGVRTLDEIFDRYGDPDSERRLTICSPNDLQPGFYYISAFILDVATILMIVAAIVFWATSLMSFYHYLMAVACIAQLLKIFIGLVMTGPFIREQLRMYDKNQ